MFLATISAYISFGLSPALWIMAIAAALYIYSPVTTKWPVVKGVYTALLVISPLMFGRHVTGIALPGGILALLATYIVFREAVLDAIDLNGDLMSGVRTVACYLGQHCTFVLGWAGMFLALAASLLFLDTPASRMAIGVGLAFQAVSALLFVMRIPHSLRVTRLTLCSGALAVALAN